MNKAAQIINDNKDEIVKKWEERVRENLEASSNAQRLALQNFVPFLLESLSKCLTRISEDRNEQDEFFKELIHLSKNHGRHRATSKNYNVKQIIDEFFSLYKVLSDVLESRGGYSAEVADGLVFIFGISIANSAGAFTHSLEDMREKLTGVLAHDIRNPISAAYLAMDVLDYNDGEERFNLIREMSKKSLKKSLNLLEGLLDAISVKAGQGMSLHFLESDIMPQIKLVHDEANQIYSNEIRFSTSKREIIGVFDGTLVKRAVENLISNAIKYGKAYAPVTITVKDKDPFVHISVHNHGEPIPEEKQKEIFKFVSRYDRDTSTSLQSWGIGLTLVQLVAEAHGGKVELVTGSEEGTTFTIIIDKTANEPGKRRAELNYSQD